MKYLLVLYSLFLNITIVQADQWVYGAAWQFETGDFSQPQDTDIITIPFNINYYTEQWGFGVEIPYVSISGSSEVIASGNGRSSIKGNGKNSSGSSSSSSSDPRAGLGDVSISVSYQFPVEKDQHISYAITAGSKLATADDNKNLGTGETDYYVKLKVSSSQGKWSPGLTIGYQITGEGSADDYNDVYFYSLGTGYSLSDKASIGFGYDFKQAISDATDDSESIGVDYTQVINRYVDLGTSISAGLSDNSPDYGISLFFTGYY